MAMQDQTDQLPKRNEILAVKPISQSSSSSKIENDSHNRSISKMVPGNTDALNQKESIQSIDQYTSTYSDIQETSADVLRALAREPPCYANQIITNELETLVTEFLKKVIYYQSRQKKLNTIQNSSNCRILSGLKEVKRHILRDRVQCVIVAKNIASDGNQDDIHGLLQEVLNLCADNSIPVIFSHTRRGLSRLFWNHDRAAISLMGILRPEGPDDLYDAVKELAWRYRIIWRCQFCTLRPLVNPRNETPLWIGAYYGYRDPLIVPECVKSGYSVNDPDCVNGETPLMIAVKQNHVHWVRFLLEADADVCTRSFSGETAMWIAASLGHSHIIIILLERALLSDKSTCLVNQTNYAGITPLGIALQNGHSEAAKILSRDDDTARTQHTPSPAS